MFVASRYNAYKITITKISGTSEANYQSSSQFIKLSVNQNILQLSFTSGGLLTFFKINAIK